MSGFHAKWRTSPLPELSQVTGTVYMVASSPHSHMCSQSTLLSIPIFSRQFLALKGDWRLHMGGSQMAQWYRICLPMQKMQVQSRVGKIPWKRRWQPTPVFLPGELHGPRSLAGFSPWGCKGSDMSEHVLVEAPRGCWSLMLHEHVEMPFLI